MDIDHLHEFVYLAETLSFQVTAKHFFISQSVLSKHISAMERDLGVKLFDREHRRVTLTEAGATFYLDMLKVINDYKRGIRHLEELSGKGNLSISIGYLRNASRPFLGAFVNYLEEKCPNAQIDITSMEYGQIIRAHRSHKIDVALTMRFDQEAEDVCEIVDVYRDKLYLIAAKDHPLAQQEEIAAREDLEGLDFVLPNPDEYPGYSDFVCGLLPAGCSDEHITHYNDIDTLFYKVQGGKHVGFSSGHNIPLAPDQIAFVPIGYAGTSYNVSGMWLKTMDPEAAKLCTDALVVCRNRLAG